MAPLASCPRRTPAQASGVKAQPSTSARGSLHVACAKKASKRCQAVLIQDVEKLGTEGELVTVQQGYMFNYLLPKRLAQPATKEYLDAIKTKLEEEQKAKQAVIDRARSLATALQTIGTIKIAKKVGEQSQIFGSVQPKEVASFIYQQTGQQIDEAKITLPEIKKLGTYDGSARLHPEVVGNFKIQVTKQANK